MDMLKKWQGLIEGVEGCMEPLAVLSSASLGRPAFKLFGSSVGIRCLEKECASDSLDA